ncbi:intracellular coagulation inhibitor 2 isoform X1 [Parasteatoda tepidariorum]|uniref:intracellular coagulation inhibitor 2 isoform X1 n=1 Tax=Parasteatoda tepidariorum TaxID=114398 RepID=UPI001C71F461|nr:intracellular coagulation inhibitor 2 isoform X1 [Parasteatoda tepidariorum]
MDSQDSKDRESSDNLALSRAINHLGFLLYQELVKKEKNIFFSPLSLSSALSMLFCGTRGSTAKEMRQVLGFEEADISDDKVKHYFQLLLASLGKAPDSYTLSCANVVLSQKDFSVKQEFKNLLLESFKALTLEVDFARETAKVLQQANDWVKERTNGMIPQLLSVLYPDTVMVLLNAVYFKGFWQNQFRKEATKPQTFYNKGLAENAKEVQMIKLKEPFLFAYSGTYKAIQLPYKGDEISMLILLPSDLNGLNKLENEVSSDFILNLMTKMYKQNVNVALPKFRLEYSKSMPKNFQNLGVTEIFVPGANFDGITDSRGIFVSDIIHKAVIEVNEEGSEAAAATAIVMARCAAPRRNVPVPEFIVDHPFLFLIQNTVTNMILFLGRVDEL